MSGECEKCNEHTLECKCNGNDKWYSFEEFPPEDGQLCVIKMVTTMQAYYIPDCKVAKWITPDHEQIVKQVATAWKPIPNSQKYRGYRPPNPSNPYEDID